MNNLEQQGPMIIEKVDPIRKISSEDLKPVIPEKGGTAIVVQCNVPDYRGAEGGPVAVGELTPEARIQAKDIAQKYFDEMFRRISPEEQKDVAIMIVAANTTLLTETGLQSDSKRAVATAEIILGEAQKMLEEKGLSKEQLLNKNGKPFEISQLKDVKFLKESPEYTQYLKDKYGTGIKFWIAFEEMLEEEKRKEFGAEGPEQIADRVKRYLSVLANGMKKWHERNPGKRVVVWIVSHRDNMAPYVRGYMNQTGQSLPKEDYLDIKKGGGFVLNIDPSGKKAQSDIQDHHFEVDLTLN